MNLIYTIWVLKLAIVLYLFLSTFIAFYLLKHSINPLFTITTIKQFIYLIYNLWNLCSSEQQVERTRATLTPLDGGREQRAAPSRQSHRGEGSCSQQMTWTVRTIGMKLFHPCRHFHLTTHCAQGLVLGRVGVGGNKGGIIWPLRNLDLTSFRWSH